MRIIGQLQIGSLLNAVLERLIFAPQLKPIRLGAPELASRRYVRARALLVGLNARLTSL